MTTTIQISGRAVGGTAPALVIAEAGFNHEGSIETALALIDAAAAAGADAIKFQSFRPNDLVLPASPLQPIFAAATLTEEEHARLAERARARRIHFCSTPFSPHWVEVLDRLGVPFFKVASMDLTNPELLDAIGRTGKPVFLSTGMATLEECRAGLARLRATGSREVVLLHCVSLYPTPPDQANLRAIRTLQETLAVPVGFSDHTLGHEVTVAAVCAGACAIEKHFTLDCTQPGPDHKLSADPDGFRRMVAAIRAVEAMLGSGEKAPAEGEKAIIAPTRRGIALSRDLAAGHVLTAQDLVLVRPATGIPAAERETVLGRKLKRALQRHHILQPEELE